MENVSYKHACMFITTLTNMYKEKERQFLNFSVMYFLNTCM